MTFPVLSQFNPETGEVVGYSPKPRFLENLKGYFLDEVAYLQALQAGNPVIYSVTSVEPAHGDGQLHYGLGKIMPGRIGREYYFTIGHLHVFRPAAEFYIGLSGEGMMLLQDEISGETLFQPLKPNLVVYVPGFMAHRTVNCGSTPLTYLGVYPAQAGHDYGSIAVKNFNKVVLEVNGQPALLDRQEACKLVSVKE
jgi:glucose-6-phosphate isomerase, archaeal